MKAQSNQIIIVIIAFLIGIAVATMFTGNDNAPNADESMTEETQGIPEPAVEEDTAMEEKAEAPTTTATNSAPAATSPKPPVANTTYSGGSCTPSLSGKKDTAFSAILLNWTPCSNLDEFQFFKLVRSETTSNPSYPANNAILSSSNKDLANYIDKTITRAKTYHYSLCVVQRLGKVSCSNVVTVSY